MRKNLCLVLAFCFFFWGIVGVANATLFNRGGGLIYDDDLNITWLQDANYVQTSGYDMDGTLTWDEATTWAENLTYANYDDWRLPTSLNPDGSGPCLSTDFACTGSEMGHLYFTELGNYFEEPISNIGPFINLADLNDFRFWSSTEYAGDSNIAWRFFMSGGRQTLHNKIGSMHAWAVRPGDSTPVPVPSTILLFGSASAGLMGLRKKFRN